VDAVLTVEVGEGHQHLMQDIRHKGLVQWAMLDLIQREDGTRGIDQIG
jgi:hypothetical protein